QSIRERVEFLRCAWLRDTRAAIACCRERCDSNVCWTRESRIRGSTKIDVELPQVERVRSKIQKEIWRTRWRKRRSIKIRWQQTTERRAQVKTDLSRCRSRPHGGAVIRAYLCARKCVREHVKRDVVGIWPNA